MIEWIVNSSVLITIVLLLRLLLRKKLSGWLRYLLWLPVLLRLLIPVSIPGTFSVMNLLPEFQPAPPVVSQQKTDEPKTDTAAPLPTPTLPTALKPQASIPTVIPQAAPVQPVTPKESISLQQLLSAVWISGIVIVSLVLIFCNGRFSLGLFKNRKAMHAPGCTLPLYITDEVATPCLFGLVRPAIYIPVTLSDPKALEYALIHEQTHYKHWDHIWSALRCAVLALHWYNPLVWVAAVASKQDAELFCDEAVIRKLGEDHRTDYGNTLIRLAYIQQGQSDILTASTTMLTTKKSLKERIYMIAKKPKAAIITIVSALLIAVIAVGCAFTGAEEPNNEAETALPFQNGQVNYLREKGGFGGDFTIELYDHGEFKYYEGNFSSYYGCGKWTLDNGILTLTDDNQNIEFKNRFRVGKDGLTWIAAESTGFTYGGYLSMADGDIFSLQSPKPAQLSYMADVCYLPQDYMDGGPLGCFLHVDGITYVWDHNVTSTLQDMQAEEIGAVISCDNTKIPDSHLSACRIPEGTVVYKGKDAGKSKYEAIYYKLEGFSLYARMLPIEAYRSTDRWWENFVSHDGSEPLTTGKLRKLQKERGKLLSRADLEAYSYVLFSGDTNGFEYRLFQVDADYRLLLVSAATVTDTEALQARFYHKDIPNYWVDLMTTDMDSYQSNLTANELNQITETEIVFDLEGFVTAESLENRTPCRITLKKTCEGARHLNTQLVVTSPTGTIRQIITPGIGPVIPDGERLHLADLDGDRVCEIILQEDLGGNGGYGAYRCRVFKVDNNTITAIFDVASENDLNTGFHLEICDNFKFIIHNRITGDSWEIEADQYRRDYYFDGTGKVAVEDPEAFQLWADSFYEFYPRDIDGDGIYEICTTQYTWDITHVDGVGDAKCVFKYDAASGSFRIIETDFVQYME